MAKAGNGQSFWTASDTDAYKLGKVESSTTTADTYTIMGDPLATNIYNYLNAYGGANHTELSSYTRDDKNSQWQLIAAEDQTFVFDVTDVTVGLDDFLDTAKNIRGATILPWTSGIGNVNAGRQLTNTAVYKLSGQRVPMSHTETLSAVSGLRSLIITNGVKHISR